jgi:hypothetical protein
VTRRDVLRLHALAARWEHYASDIDHATTQKLAHANVLHAAKNRWRRLRRKLMHKAHTSESTLDESKRLDRLKLHTKESLRGFGELQWAQKDQHDRDKKERHATAKLEKKAKLRAKSMRVMANANAQAEAYAGESSLLKGRSDKRVRVVSHRTTQRLEQAALAALKQRRADTELENLAGSEDDDDDDVLVVNDDNDIDDDEDADHDDKPTIVIATASENNNTATNNNTTTNNNNNNTSKEKNKSKKDDNDDNDDDDDLHKDDGPKLAVPRNKSGMGYEHLKQSATWSEDNDTNATATPLIERRRETVVAVNEADLATLDASLDVRMPTGQLVRMMTPRSTRKRLSTSKPTG